MSNYEVSELIGQINTAFEEFKAHHSEEVGELRRAVDDMAIRNAAEEMSGTRRVPEVDGVKALRTADDFRAHYGNPQASGATLHDFMRGVAGLKTSEAAVKALSEGTNTAGGYAVPDVVMPAILGAMVPASSLLQAGAGVVPLERGAKSATTAIVDTLPTAAWREELGTVAESDPTFRGVVATPRSLSCIVRVSRELLADAPDMDRALREVIAQAFAKELDRVGLVGSGTAPEPRGLLNTAGVNSITLGAGDGLALSDYGTILAGMAPILAANGPVPTAAIMAPRTLLDFNGLMDTTNQPLGKPSLVEPVRFLSTSQVAENETVGTSTDCSNLYLGDFARMHFLLRENLSIRALGEAYAKTGEIGFLCHARADVVVPYPAAFTVVKGIRPA